MKLDGGMWEPQGVTVTSRSTSPSIHDTRTTESESCLAKGDQSHINTHTAEDKTPPSLWQHLYHRTWLLEILAIAFSLLCFGAIVVILGVYHNSTRPEMPYGLTLNAIVSALAVASKSSLLCAVAGAISQLKWCWFKEDRNLKDLQSYDDASRGPAGSTAFMFSARPSLATVGALITVLTLVFDPFVQQVIQYPSRPSTSSSPAAVADKASIFSTDLESFRSLKAINAGIWADASDFDLRPSCPGGDCSWPAFQSMGWCSKCTDVTSTAVLDGDCNTHAPAQDLNTTCGIYTRTGQGTGALAFRYRERTGHMHMNQRVTWLVDSSEPSASQPWLGIEQPLLVLGYASLGLHMGPNVMDSQVIPMPTIQHAEECVLTPCLRTYALQVVDGLTKSVVPSVNYGTIHSVKFRTVLEGGVTIAGTTTSPGTTISSETCWQPEDTAVSYKQATNSTHWRFFNTTRNSFCELSSYVYSIGSRLTAEVAISGHYTSDNSTRRLTSFGPTGDASDSLQAIWSTNLSYVVENVAASLTKLALDLANETVTGNITRSETYVQVDWQWLALPICLEALGLLLLLAAILHSSTSKVPLWRSSLLPLLYHGIPPPVSEERNLSADICAMERHAKGFKARIASTAYS